MWHVLIAVIFVAIAVMHMVALYIIALVVASAHVVAITLMVACTLIHVVALALIVAFALVVGFAVAICMYMYVWYVTCIHLGNARESVNRRMHCTVVMLLKTERSSYTYVYYHNIISMLVIMKGNGNFFGGYHILPSPWKYSCRQL